MTHELLCQMNPQPVTFSRLLTTATLYQFKCDLCNAGYVDDMQQHLHQCAEEHKGTFNSIGKHFCVKHSDVPKDLTKNCTS